MQLGVNPEAMAVQLERAQEVASKLAMVMDAVRDLATCLTAREVGDVLLTVARNVTGAAECELWLKGTDGGILRAVGGNGERGNDVLEASRSHLLLRTLERGESVVEYDGRNEASANRSPVRVALPVLARHELLGVLELANLAAPQHWDEQKIALDRVIPVAGMALKNTLLLEENKLANEKLNQTLASGEESARQLGAKNEELERQRREILIRDEENALLLEQAIDERNRIEAIVSSSADGIMVTDSEKKITMVNGALEDLTGYRAEDLIGQPCGHLLDARDSSGECLCDFACPHLGSHLLAGHTVDTTIASKSGDRVWVGIATGVVRDEDGEGIRGVVHTFRDMTKYKEADRLKDEFISVASHELMTPLTALKGFAQLAQKLGRKSSSHDGLTRALDILNEEVDRLVALVTRLVDVSRLEAKKLDIHKKEFDLFDLAESVVGRLRATTSVHNLRLVGNRPVMLFADRQQIEEVLTNLVGNAVKYSPLGGEVEVCVESQVGYVQVSVSDEGIGIPPDKQGRIFDQFYRAHDGPRGYSKGMGIGLYICKEIISSHGGQIWVRSEEGKGSVFYFTLPEEED